MSRHTSFKIAMPLLATAFATQIQAQDTQPVNNGTNPTLLTTRATLTYQYNRVNAGPSLNTDVFEASVSAPFGPTRNMALEFTLPYANGPFDSSFDTGDISLKFIHVADLNARRGLAYSVEYFADTASRPDIGNGEDVLEVSAFYAAFLQNGNIFAPAIVQTMGLDGGNAAGNKINRTALDFYYVPRLEDPKYFITLDPSLSYDWETDKGFAGLQVTLGMITGKAFGGDAQVFVKPGIYAGEDRPLDFSFQVGFRVLNF